MTRNLFFAPPSRSFGGDGRDGGYGLAGRGFDGCPVGGGGADMLRRAGDGGGVLPSIIYLHETSVTGRERRWFSAIDGTLSGDV